MNLAEIKQAIKEGKSVKWSNDSYDVIKDKTGEYLIIWGRNKHAIGLTWRDGVTMNGKASQFYINEAISEN